MGCGPGRAGGGRGGWPTDPQSIAEQYRQSADEKGTSPSGVQYTPGGGQDNSNDALPQPHVIVVAAGLHPVWSTAPLSHQGQWRATPVLHMALPRLTPSMLTTLAAKTAQRHGPCYNARQTEKEARHVCSHHDKVGGGHLARRSTATVGGEDGRFPRAGSTAAVKSPAPITIAQRL